MFPYPNPKTPNAALRQALIAERVLEMHTGFDYYWYACGNGVFGVARRSFSAKRDTAYTVKIDPALSCDCLDFETHKDFCKHIVYLWEEQERIEELCAEAEQMMDAESANGCDYSDGPLSAEGCRW